MTEPLYAWRLMSDRDTPVGGFVQRKAAEGETEWCVVDEVLETEFRVHRATQEELAQEFQRLRKIEKLARLIRDDLKRSAGTVNITLEAELDDALFPELVEEHQECERGKRGECEICYQRAEKKG